MNDLYDAVNQHTASNQIHPSNLYGVYATRETKPMHNRPLPLPDALLQGSDEDAARSSLDIKWLANVIDSPWLWELQWTTLCMLFASSDLCKKLEPHCPANVASKWLKHLPNRVHMKLLGASVETGCPDGTAAMSPLMLVTSELLLLRMTYEL